MQRNGGFTASGDALDHQHLPGVGADQIVLVLLDRRDDVAQLGFAPAGEDFAQIRVGVNQAWPGLGGRGG